MYAILMYKKKARTSSKECAFENEMPGAHADISDEVRRARPVDCSLIITLSFSVV